ncbi:hypothetical protein BGZ65_011478, partial [Modicella reniformis]
MGEQSTQKINNILERVQQTQQQMEDVLQKIQQTDQQQLQHQKQIDDIMQQAHQMSQQMHERSQDNHQIREEAKQCLKQSSQLQRQEFDRLMIIKSHAQALLIRSFQELPIPRLFIVLPNADLRSQRRVQVNSLQFRLYYLCECGDHTMNENSKGLHEIHMAEHPGYEVDNHNEFFNKYGSYLLTMMYMVKYGAVAAGRVVPSLQNLKIAKEINMDRTRLRQLVDDTLSYLEDTLNNNYTDLTANWELDLTELAQLKSYLKVKDEMV